VYETMADLRSADVDCLAVGQYLRPGLAQEPVREYVAPAVFEELAARARRMGFREATAGPLVRSSYRGGGAGPVHDPARTADSEEEDVQ